MADIIGPGSVQEAPSDVRPLLEGASEYEYVTILNPLSQDFAVRVAQDVPVDMPFELRNKTSMVKDGRDITMQYGLDLKNADFKARRSVHNDTVIPAGKTVNMRGNEAQVAVRQLVNEIMQREGNTRHLADPEQRNRVEQRIIISRGTVEQLMEGANLRSVRDQTTEVIKKSNEANNETFPGLTELTADRSAAAGGTSGADAAAPERRAPGRPKAA